MVGDGSAGGFRRAALFVDFENVYIGLCNSSREAARRFATEPRRWVEWMEQALGPFLVELEDQPRTLLRRICYLDPARSSRFRPYFTRAGFRVVDCPALTAAGKNSADIYMVLDILDTLAHPTWYDEFIVLSVDADFTPVLLRLREHDRRTAMLVSGPAAAAMRAACDFAIPDSMFLDEALGMGIEDVGGGGVDPAVGSPAADDELRRRMAAVVRDLVASSAQPVAMARAAHEVRRVVGTVVDTSGWAGWGSFGKFAADLVSDDLHIDTSRPPGWLYDPGRHGDPDRPGAVPTLPDIPEVAERVSRITGVPPLSADTYRVLFEVLVTDARPAAVHGQAEAERTARDACVARGRPVPRGAVHFVLLGFRYSNVDWTADTMDAGALAAAFADNAVRLAADAQMDLTIEEQAEIREWIGES